MFRFFKVVFITVVFHIFNFSNAQVLINEVVTDPQTDWSSTMFSGQDGGGRISDGVDEYVELYILTTGLSLEGWTIELNDESIVTGDLTPTGAFHVSNYITLGSGSFFYTQSGDYLLLGNVAGSGAMNNVITIILKDNLGHIIDHVELGGEGETAPNGSATSIANESVCRLGNGKNTNVDSDDFYKTKATPGATNSPSGEILINEIVTSPQTDWSTTGFNGVDGGGVVSDGVDEFIELYIKTAGMNLNGYTIELLDRTTVIGDLKAGGAFQVSNYLSTNGGFFYDTEVGDFLVLGNVIGLESMNNNVLVKLRDSNGQLVDSVYFSKGAPSGNSSGKSDEAVSRYPNGIDSNSATDFINSYASPSIINTNTPLPIKLFSFKAEVIFQLVELKWCTVSEYDNDFFSVERSKDGNHWEQIGEIVSGAGRSSQLINYSLLDESPQAGINYYRLRQTDLDGSYSFSSIEAVKVDKQSTSEFDVYPNPFEEVLMLHTTIKNELNGLKLFSFDNTEVTSQMVTIKHSEYERKLIFKNLPSGIYLLKSTNSMKKIVKK